MSVRSTFGLRAKFMLAFAIPIVLVSIVLSAIELRVVRRAMLEQTRQQGEAITSIVEASAAHYVAAEHREDLKSVVERLAKSPSVEYVDFVAPDGAVLMTSKPETPPALKGRKLQRESAADVGDQFYLFVVPIQDLGAFGTGTTQAYFRLVLNESQARSVAGSIRWADFLVTLAAVALALVAARIAGRFLVTPVMTLASTAEKIAQGDLTQRAQVASGDEIGTLGDAFNAMAANLERTVKSLAHAQQKLKGVGETVDTRAQTVIQRVDEQRAIIDETYHSIDKLNIGVRKISENVEALSASSEETSSSMLEMVASMEEVSRHTDTLFESVEETASATQQMVTSISEVDQNVVYLTNFVTETSSAMVEMSASIAQVEVHAALSSDLSQAVADAAEQGMAAVRETIEGMEQIRQSVVASNLVVTRLGDRSVAIGKILNVIEDVAEQTNLLALNAAILAAQAGEYGKGFSVVAAEIRELSERTATSTRDIANLIRSVQDEVSNALDTMGAGSRLVEHGVSLSHDAGKALNNILEAATKASGMGKEIANATREQATGSETVTRSVDRLQDMVRQISSATAQQSQGSSHIMKAVESMREVTKYVRQAMVEQKSGSSMISSAAERMIEMIHEIFQVAANQSGESEKIVATMEQVRSIADLNRNQAGEMTEAIGLLNDAIRSLDDEVRKFRTRG